MAPQESTEPIDPSHPEKHILPQVSDLAYQVQTELKLAQDVYQEWTGSSPPILGRLDQFISSTRGGTYTPQEKDFTWLLGSMATNEGVHIQSDTTKKYLTGAVEFWGNQHQAALEKDASSENSARTGQVYEAVSDALNGLQGNGPIDRTISYFAKLTQACREMKPADGSDSPAVLSRLEVFYDEMGQETKKQGVHTAEQQQGQRIRDQISSLEQSISQMEQDKNRLTELLSQSQTENTQLQSKIAALEKTVARLKHKRGIASTIVRFFTGKDLAPTDEP